MCNARAAMGMAGHVSLRWGSIRRFEAQAADAMARPARLWLGLVFPRYPEPC
jgi:hypothetical protein